MSAPSSPPPDSRRAATDAVAEQNRLLQDIGAGAAEARRDAGTRTGTHAGGSPPSDRLLVHRVVDTGIDLLGDMTDLAAVVGRRLYERRPWRPSSPTGSSSTDPATLAAAQRGPAVLELPRVSPGATSAARAMVENPSRSWLNALSLGCPGLAANGGGHIPGHFVTTDPPAVEVPPEGTRTFTVLVQVPNTTLRGTYVGVLSPRGNRTVQLLLSLEVV